MQLTIEEANKLNDIVSDTILVHHISASILFDFEHRIILLNLHL